ncbi:hypothetical protein ACFLY3_04675 [Chloroflexota bacterium]
MNETKTAILTCLSGGEWWTTPQVAQWCGLKLTNVSELLRRYRGQGLVNRNRNPSVPRGYLYRITDVGLKRMRYLMFVETSTGLAAHDQTSPADEGYLDSGTGAGLVIANQIGLVGKKKSIFAQWVEEKIGG